MTSPLVSVIVLAYGDEPVLQECLASVLASVKPTGELLDLEVVLVDNGAATAVAALSPDPRLTTLTMPQNTGFAGGCNVGAQQARGEHVVFLNSDAVLEPLSVWSLIHELEDPTVGLTCGSVRFLHRPQVMNSCGNPVHFLGVGWAGGYDEPATLHEVSCDVTAASGAFFAARRATWNDLEGFDPLYFAYHEDAELSLRCWQRGLRVRYCAEAVALHDYDFSRHPEKSYLLERNRWLALCTLYPTSLVLAVLPALLAFEIAVLVLAAIQGWLPAKVRGYRWLIRHSSEIRQQRRKVQADNRLSPSEFAGLLTPRLEPAVLGHVPGLAALNMLLVAYWRLVTRLLPRST